MSKEIILDTAKLRPNRVCEVCKEPLNIGRTMIVEGKGRITGYKKLKLYHAVCYATLTAT